MQVENFDWLVDWLIGWLIDWLIGWLIDWLTDWQAEMEEQNENTQSDYWLVQYQRLMDRKPQAMFNMVSFYYESEQYFNMK